MGSSTKKIGPKNEVGLYLGSRSLYSSRDIDANACFRFALKPDGGSFVSLIHLSVRDVCFEGNVGKEGGWTKGKLDDDEQHEIFNIWDERCCTACLYHREKSDVNIFLVPLEFLIPCEWHSPTRTKDKKCCYC